MLQFQIKPLTSKQLNQVIELDQLCFGGLWTKDGYQREIDSPNSTLLVISLSCGSDEPASNSQTREKIIGLGCFWAILEEAHITLLAIHPDYQGQGLGQFLLYALLQDAIARKLERATLEVRASNQAALALYEKFGFKTAGRRKGYYQETGEDALILWRGDLAKPEFLVNLNTWEAQIGDRLAQSNWQLNYEL